MFVMLLFCCFVFLGRDNCFEYLVQILLMDVVFVVMVVGGGS